MTLNLPAARAPLDIEPGDVVRERGSCRYPHPADWADCDLSGRQMLVVDAIVGHDGWPMVKLAGMSALWWCMGCLTKVDPGELVEQEHSEWALDLARGRELIDHRMDALRYAMGGRMIGKTEARRRAFARYDLAKGGNHDLIEPRVLRSVRPESGKHPRAGRRACACHAHHRPGQAPQLAPPPGLAAMNEPPQMRWRGILFGLAFSVPIWALIVWCWR